MSSKSNATLTRSTRAKKRSGSRALKVVLCLRNNGYEVSLEPRKIYEVLSDREAAEHNQIRVIDESGEDYLYPVTLFAQIVLPQPIRKALLAAR